jgi:Cysteine rich repeat
MRRPSTVSARFAAPFLLLCTAAFAQTTPPPAGSPPPKGGACRADIAALCPNLPPGRADHRAIVQCLESQADKVSAPCKAEMDAMKAKAEAAKEACQPDVDKFCAGVAAGGGRIRDCLNQHESELSDACKAAQPKHHGPPPAAPPAQPKP